MTTHPHFSDFPTPEEVRAIAHRARQERAQYMHDSVVRLFRAIAGFAAPRRHDEELRFPTVSFGARR